MTYGISIDNPSGKLVLSSEAQGLSYLGKAVLFSSVASTSTEIGSVKLRVTSTYLPLVFVGLALDRFIRVLSVVNVIGTTWEITMRYAGSPSVGSGPLTTYTNPDVYCFARPAALGGSFGAAIYDAAGALAWDLTRRFLVLSASVDFTTAAQTIGTFPALTYPAVMGDTGGTELRSGGAGPIYPTDEYERHFARLTGSATTLRRDSIFARFVANEDANQTATFFAPTEAVLIEAGGLT